MSKYVLSKNSKRNRDRVNGGVDPRLAEISDLALSISLVDFGHGPHSGKRSAAEQNQLHRDGVSPNCDGYESLSNHQTGHALDFYAYVDGRASWAHEHLAMVAAAFLQAASILGYQLSWGGLWVSSKGGIYGWDCPHVELLD